MNSKIIEVKTCDMCFKLISFKQAGQWSISTRKPGERYWTCLDCSKWIEHTLEQQESDAYYD